MNTDEQQENAQIRERIWKVIGKDPTTVVGPIWIDGPRWDSGSWSDEPVISAEYVHDEEDVSYADLSGSGTGFGVYSAEWAMGMTGGGSAMHAQDLGDDFLYFIQTEDSEGDWLVGVVPKAQQENVLQDLRLKWIQEHEGLGISSYPSDIGGIDFTNPNMIRAMTLRLLRDESTGWTADEKVTNLSESLTAVEFGRRIYGANLSDSELRIRLLRYWKASASTSPPVPAGTLPPGFDDLERDDTFDAWLQNVELAWRDTGEQLEIRTARAFRVTCQYLAMVDRSL